MNQIGGALVGNTPLNSKLLSIGLHVHVNSLRTLA